MKCVKNIVTDQVKRISDDDAYKLVSKGDWAWCPKKEWKNNVRGPVKTKAPGKKAAKEVEMDEYGLPMKKVKKAKSEGKGQSKYQQKKGKEEKGEVSS